jgi:hypothetical protein
MEKAWEKMLKSGTLFEQIESVYTRIVITPSTLKLSHKLNCLIFYLCDFCFIGRSWQSMKERYRKVLSRKLDQYLPSDVVDQIMKAELRGKHMM